MPNATYSPALLASQEPNRSTPSAPPGKRLTGEQAVVFRAHVVSLYSEPNPMSIRAICAETGRSYGNIHTVLKKAGAARRPRGFQKPSRPKVHRDG
ncbi:helix-turn-helix domain-containing protein, partial [Streptomyces sp. NPDC055140]